MTACDRVIDSSHYFDSLATGFDLEAYRRRMAAVPGTTVAYAPPWSVTDDRRRQTPATITSLTPVGGPVMKPVKLLGKRIIDPAYRPTVGA